MPVIYEYFDISSPAILEHLAVYLYIRRSIALTESFILTNLSYFFLIFALEMDHQIFGAPPIHCSIYPIVIAASTTAYPKHSFLSWTCPHKQRVHRDSDWCIVLWMSVESVVMFNSFKSTTKATHIGSSKLN